MAVKKSQSNDKLLWKVMPSSYHVEEKTFVEATANDINTGEKGFCSSYF